MTTTAPPSTPSMRVPVADVDHARLEHLARQHCVTKAEVAAELIHRALHNDARPLTIELDPVDMELLNTIAMATGGTPAEIVAHIVTRALEARRHEATRQRSIDPTTRST